MTFYTAFSNRKDFCPVHHGRNDMKVLSLNIRHEEGALPILSIRGVFSDNNLAQAQAGFAQNHFIFISHAKKCDAYDAPLSEKCAVPVLVFQGQPLGVPCRKEDGVWELEYQGVVVSRDCIDHKTGFNAKKRQVRAKDFQELRYGCDITQFLQNHWGMVEYERSARALMYVPWDTSHTFFTPKDVFKGSVKTHTTEKPFCGVDVEIKSAWVQEVVGEGDVAPFLEAAFPQGRINTLTPQHMLQYFPKVGSSLCSAPQQEPAHATVPMERLTPHPYGQSSPRLERQNAGIKNRNTGYHIVESELRVLSPLYTGILDIYPTVSDTFWQKCMQDTHPAPVMFERVWFASRLVVSWEYRQKREETVVLRLSEHFTEKGTLFLERESVDATKDIAALSSRKQITLTFDGVIPCNTVSFFHSKAGEEAVIFALQHAACFLKRSARCTEVSFRISMQEGMHIGVHHSVDIGALLGLTQKVVAKVVRYRLFQSFGEGYVDVHCALSAPLGTHIRGGDIPYAQSSRPMFSLAHTKSQDYVAFGGVKKEFSVVHEHQAILDAIRRRIQPKGLVKTDLTVKDIVKEVRVKNDGLKQNLILKQHAYPATMGRLGRVLATHPTSFDIALLDLRTKPTLHEHVIVDGIRLHPFAVTKGEENAI